MDFTSPFRYSVFILIASMMVGCASLPSEPDDRAVLIIPLHVSAAPGNSIWWDYQIFAEHSGTGNVQPFFIRPQVGKQYDTVILRESGTFRLNGWNSRSKNSNRVNSHNISRQAVAHGGYINVYEFRMVVRSENNRQGWEFEYIPYEERQAIAEEYQRSVRNGEHWPIFETW